MLYCLTNMLKKFHRMHFKSLVFQTSCAGSFGDDNGPMGLRVLGIYSRVYLKWNMVFCPGKKTNVFKVGFRKKNTLTIRKNKVT